MINLDVKGYLAKLIASENITIQHNKVKTASFDVKNRILTLPIFKEKSGDVYDMLIAHECAHALWTPYKEWAEICEDDELRAYVNVLEDTRIDKLIQNKYPGVVKNYENGFDILEKQNFFGISGKDINKDLMIIDKINLRSKSLNRLPFVFAPLDNKWLAKVDNVKTFSDVLTLAKEMLNWQKDQVEQMKKLPLFLEKRKENFNHLEAGIKNIQGAPVGDTILDSRNDASSPLPGFQKVMPKVFASLFTVDSDEYEKFRDALSKLVLNDSALIYAVSYTHLTLPTNREV